ncbi:MAG: hypothetical protein ACI4ET_07165 [Bilifractor sp.]
MTKKQEKYVLARVAGKTQRDAYIEAFGGNAKPASIDVLACRLEKKPEIAAKIAELNELAKVKAEREAVKNVRGKVKIEDDTVNMRARIIREYQRIAFGEAEDIETEYVYGKDGVAKPIRTYKRSQNRAKIQALKKLAEIYGVTQADEQSGIRVEIPDEYKDYMA